MFVLISRWGVVYIYIVASFSGIGECFDLRAYVYANRSGSVSQTWDDIPVQVWLRSGVRYTGGTRDICVERKWRAEVVELRYKELNMNLLILFELFWFIHLKK